MRTGSVRCSSRLVGVVKRVRLSIWQENAETYRLHTYTRLSLQRLVQAIAGAGAQPYVGVGHAHCVKDMLKLSTISDGTIGKFIERINKGKSGCSGTL